MTPRTFGATLALLCAGGCAATDADFGRERAGMAASIRDEVRSIAPDADDRYLEAALEAVATVPRERFVSHALRVQAYRPIPLPIGHGQTVTDAQAVAVMVAAARIGPQSNVLDVGTGSGYQAAVISRIARRVSSIEILKPLAITAARRLKALGYLNVEVRAGDGYAGWPDRAPFDAIIVAAGASAVPRPLLDQLRPGGRLVMPIGATWAVEQALVYTRRVDGGFDRCSLGWTMFVPLTGRGERTAGAAGLFDKTIQLCHAAALLSPIFVPAGGNRSPGRHSKHAVGLNFGKGPLPEEAARRGRTAADLRAPSSDGHPPRRTTLATWPGSR